MKRETLSEAASKAMLREQPMLRACFATEFEVRDADAAVDAAESIGFPVALKLCGARIAHKTERGLVKLRLADAEAVRTAAQSLLGAATAEDGPVTLLVAPMIGGSRELIAGVTQDPQFGPVVMVGIGGIFAEAVADVQFRIAPLSEADAHDMLDSLTAQKLLGEMRGEAAVDRVRVAHVLMGLSELATTRHDLVSVDINPLIITAAGKPMAVDALAELGTPAGVAPAATRAAPRAEHFRALFEPKGVLIAGASTHPGKFGFVGLHNVLASGYRGAVFGTNLEGEEVLGIRTVADVHALPDGAVDLVFVCTPSSANEDLLRACAAKGITAAFVTSAGYREAGESGAAAEQRLVAVADELDMLLAGPNGQGLVSTPANLCAQIVGPYPPRGRIAIASQSGNLVSTFMNYARQTGVGVSRAVSAGNAAAVAPGDYLEWFASDPETAVSLSYIEGITDGRALMRTFQCARTKPLVVVKGGATAGGARAAASHTGALAADDRVFDGLCRQFGVTRAATVEEAFDAAATFATQPLPKGPNVVVLTTAGGWGVVTSDAIGRSGILRLLALPDDLMAAIDTKLPPRWSRNNPVDCAGGETRDTIPEVLELITAHPDVDAVIFLGLGIQSNQARLMREGGFYPDHGLERIVSYHERQDQRFAEATIELSERFQKPILAATELAVADPDNAGPATIRAAGRLCYASGNRAVTALAHLTRYALFRTRPT